MTVDMIVAHKEVDAGLMTSRESYPLWMKGL